MLFCADHHPARQYAHRTLERARVDVHNEALYTLGLKKGCGKSHRRWIIRAEQFFHSSIMAHPSPSCRA